MQLNQKQIKELHPDIHAIFWEDKTIIKRSDEPLHDYLIRKNIKCFCSICRRKGI